MISKSIRLNDIALPLITGEYAMIPFDLKTLSGLPLRFLATVREMLSGVENNGGTAYFTIHGKKLKKGETLRRGGPHTDGNYEPHRMSFGGGGWKVGQDGPGVNTEMHERQYTNELGGIILASNYEACIGWNGEYQGLPNTGGDCEHIPLGESFTLDRNKVYYGNNHFIHESLPLTGDAHRVFVRITMPEDHTFNQ